MKFIIGARGAGKTTALVEKAAKEHLYIVCRDRARADDVFRGALSEGFNIPNPITFDDLICGRFHGKGIRGFLIDDVDALLQLVARGVPVVAAAMTDGEGIEVECLPGTFRGNR